MNTISEFDLLTGQPFPIDGIGTFRAPKLKDLFSVTGIGLQRYNLMLSLLSMDTEDFLRAVGLNESYESLTPDKKEQFTPFLLITAIKDYRDIFTDALDFFMVETAVFDAKSNNFVLLAQDGSIRGAVSEANYDDLRVALLRANCLSIDSAVKPKKYKNKKAQYVYEKIAAAKKKQAAAHMDESLSIWNVASSVSARHYSYNLLNIWDLTIYQLYDQFSKLNLNHQVDVGALRWAAWGEDQFDFSLWYKQT